MLALVHGSFYTLSPEEMIEMIRHSNSSFFVRVLILISAAIVGIILASEAALYLNLQRHYDRSVRQLQHALSLDPQDRIARQLLRTMESRSVP